MVGALIGYCQMEGAWCVLQTELVFQVWFQNLVPISSLGAPPWFQCPLCSLGFQRLFLCLSVQIPSQTFPHDDVQPSLPPTVLPCLLGSRWKLNSVETRENHVTDSV